MKAIAIPKEVLIHEIEYSKAAGRDDWNNVRYDEPITIEFVRFDHATGFSRDSRETKVLYDGIVFIDTTHSMPIPELVEQSKIEFKGRTYIIQKVIPLYFPFSNKVRHYELEVM